MFVSKSVIESLIVELALRGEFERDSAHELLYHLSTPGPTVPSCVAEVIIEHPEIHDQPNQLPARIAFGMVDDALCRFDLEMRKQRQLKFFRGLNLVRLALQEQEFPDTAIARSKDYHASLLFSAEALQRLAEVETIFPAEASTLVEQLLAVHLELEAVSELLMEIQIRRLTRTVRSRLKLRVESALETGRDYPAADSFSLTSLHEPIGFRATVREHEHFERSTHRLGQLLDSLC